MQDLIPVMADALATLSAGRAVQPVRVVVPVAEHHGFFGVMPAYAGGALGAKLVTWYPNNQGVPTHHAIVQLFRPETGEPLVTMDGTLITEMRTGAVSAVATDRLARPDAPSWRFSDPACRRGATSRRCAWSGRSATCASGVHGTRVRSRRITDVRAIGSAEEAVRGADVIVVATMSRVPVLSGAWLSPGAHINAVGAVRPDWRELDDEVVTRARLFVESREAASRESGDVIASRGIVAEIGEVVAGTARGRETADEITLFKSVGVAVEDVSTASLVYRLAIAGTGPRPD